MKNENILSSSSFLWAHFVSVWTDKAKYSSGTKGEHRDSKWNSKWNSWQRKISCCIMGSSTAKSGEQGLGTKTQISADWRTQNRAASGMSFSFLSPFFFFKICLFVCLLLAVLGLHYCVRAFSSCGWWGLVSSCGPWTSRCGGFSCCGTRALGQRAQ